MKDMFVRFVEMDAIESLQTCSEVIGFDARCVALLWM